jgi:hypothetical protein
VSSADETAFEVRALLASSVRASSVRGDRHGGAHRFLSSGDVAWFSTLGGRLLGPELATAEPVTWD